MQSPGAPMSRTPRDHVAAHECSMRNYEELMRSESCGCFYCLAIFPPTEINEWIEESHAGPGKTGRCPKCGIDSVIGSAAGYPITRTYLDEMRRHWF